MTTTLAVSCLLIVVVSVGCWLSWLATRVERAHARVDRTWAILDTALVRRAQRSAEIAARPGPDPAGSLLVGDAAAAALELALGDERREQAESRLTHALHLVGLAGVEREAERAALARRLHNDAVSTALSLRRRPVVRRCRLAARAPQPRPFEMADPDPDTAPPPGAAADVVSGPARGGLEGRRPWVD